MSSYPATVRHLALLLSMLHCPSPGMPELEAKLVLGAPPTFIILHEVSSLFVDPELECVVPKHVQEHAANRSKAQLALII
jgi:hypothetical protein